MKGIGGNVTATLQISETETNAIGEQVRTWADLKDSTHVFVADYTKLPAELAAENGRLVCRGKCYDVLLIDNPMEMQSGSQLEIYLKFTGGSTHAD